MSKVFIVTSGPTNERIDDVMKITNMSTGKLGAIVVDRLLEIAPENEIAKIYYVCSKTAARPSVKTSLVREVVVESTDDMLNTLRCLLKSSEHIDAIVHAAAVGDYKTTYTARAEDIADELIQKQCEKGGVLSHDEIMEVLCEPRCVVGNNDTKISSYENHLMVMLGLTPKVIGNIKKFSPDTKLIGFKLLDNVSRNELFSVADALRKKNSADYIVANDLSKIGNGRHWAMIVSEDGVVAECETKLGIAEAIAGLIL